tara:strand:+ start:83 stop:496 length:414 start_codon:yes stop_codon:yes gene_type:complete
MALIDQLLDEIRDEVIKNVPQPKVLQLSNWGDVVDHLSPELEEMVRDLVQVRDTMSYLSSYHDDRRTNVCRSVTSAHRQAVNNVTKLQGIIDIIKCPANTMLQANEAEAAKYKEAVAQACRDYIEKELYMKVEEALS